MAVTVRLAGQAAETVTVVGPAAGPARPLIQARHGTCTIVLRRRSGGIRVGFARPLDCRY